jgi:ArsR family transcriptional regulator, cadmium/lead-responsive transcriptional repressor
VLTDVSVLTDALRVSKSRSDIEVASQLFHALSDRTRLSLLDELSEGELRVTALVRRIDGTQGNVSGHLACMKGCGLVLDRRKGREVFYRIAHPQVIAVLRAATDLLALNGSNVSLCTHYEDPDADCAPTPRSQTKRKAKVGAA